MRLETSIRPLSSPFSRFLVAVALMGAALSGGLGYSRIAAELGHPDAARMTTAQAARRMMTLCNQYEGPCEILATPYYRDNTNLGYPPYNLHRKIWQGMLYSNGHILHVILNDATGRPGSVYDGGDAVKTSAQQDRETPVTTPVEAARLSLHYLRSLEIVPARAEVALSGNPEQVHGSGQWWITWKVRSAPGARPIMVKAALSSKTGRILSAVNREQMGQIQ